MLTAFNMLTAAPTGTYVPRKQLPIAGITWLLAVIIGAHVFAQNLTREPAAGDPGNEDPERRQTLQLILKTETEIRGSLFVAAAESFDAAWNLAVRHEDPLLTLRTGRDDLLKPGQHQTQAGARARLEQVFRSAPESFRKRYHEHVSANASRAADQAMAPGQQNELIKFVLRYQFTPAAQQVLQQIIRLHVSRGEYLQAALQFGRLIRLRDDSNAENLLTLAMLWWKAGLTEEAVDYLRASVAASDGSPILLNGRSVTLPSNEGGHDDWLASQLDDVSGRGRQMPSSVSANWTQPGGNYRRTMTQSTAPELLEFAWQKSTFHCLQFPQLNRILTPLISEIQGKTALFRAIGRPRIPAAAPLIVDDMLIYRCVANIQAVERTTGDILWETLPLDRRMEQAVEALRRAPDDAGRLQLISHQLEDELVNHLARANCGGQLTCDGRYLFAVEDATSETMSVRLDEQLPAGPIPVNYLRVYDVRTGSFRGQAGGNSGSSAAGGRAHPMAGMYFLGAPLVMGDRIYVMAENDQGIFLLQLQARHPWGSNSQGEIDLTPVSSQLLSIPRYSLRQHPVRKYAGAIPSYSQGLLVCNTCDEQVFAVSAEDHSIRWIYRYAGNVAPAELGHGIPRIGNAFDNRESERLDHSTRWLDALPRISAGRVLLTPRDSDRMICLDLQTGQELWSKPRGNLRKIVLFNRNRLVVTGTTSVESFDPVTGQSQWKKRIREGIVCGASCSDGQLLHVPVSTPALITLDIISGRQIVVQPVGGQALGNLVSHRGTLYSQTLTVVSGLTTPESRHESAIATATRQLFNGQPDEAELLLKQVVSNAGASEDERRHALDMLMSLHLESLRVDYPGTAERVPEIKQLLSAFADTHEKWPEVIQSMLGMTPADAAVLPGYWQHFHRMEQYRDQVQQLVASGKLNNETEPAASIASTISELFAQAAESPDAAITSNQLIQRRSRQLAGVVRNAISRRTRDEQEAIRQHLSTELLSQIRGAPTPELAAWWIDICLAIDQPEPAMRASAENSDTALPTKSAGVRRELVRMTAADRLPDKPATLAAEQLLAEWDSGDRQDLIAATLSRSTPDADQKNRFANVSPRPLATTLLFSRQALRDQVAEWQTRFGADGADNLPPIPWTSVPTATASPAHSAQRRPTSPLLPFAPRQTIPIFGPPGAFSKWELVQTGDSDTVFACDGEGRLRWTFSPDSVSGRRSIGTFGPQLEHMYAVAYGNLLAIKLRHMLFVLDCSRASTDTPPVQLWQMNLEAVMRPSGRPADFMPGYQSITQYERQPAGLQPLGPITLHGIPLLAQGQLVMLNPMTGDTEWQVSGLPSDATISATDSELALISPSAGQIEVRSVIDGTVIRNHPVPDWWIDAAENSGASIRDFEMEPGDELRWLLEVSQNRCLLHTRKQGASAIELFELSTNTLVWSFALPPESVVSNIVDGYIAVLSNGDELQILNTVTGRRHSVSDVNAAVNSQFLYLRASAGQWLVLTDVPSDDWEDRGMIRQSVPVNGFTYAIDQMNGQLTWQAAIDREHLRCRRTSGNPPHPIPEFAPVLLLMKRPRWDSTGAKTIRGARYQARIIDVRSGRQLIQDDDLGVQLSDHKISLDHKKNTIEIAFEKRNLLLDYGGSGSGEPE